VVNNKRLDVFDVIKGVAVLLMIQVHITELITTEGIFESMFGTVSLFLGAAPVAPAFMFVLGYFLARSKKTTKAMIKRGFMTLCMGFVLNFALNFNLIISVFFGRFETHLWPYLLGVDILHFAGLAIMVVALFKHLFNKNILLFVLIALLSAFLGQYLKFYNTENVVLKYLFSFVYGASWWSYFPLFPWLAYPLAGVVFYKLQENKTLIAYLPKRIQITSIIVLLTVLFFTLGFSVKISSHLPLYYHHGLIYFLWTMAFIIVYTYVLTKIEKYTGGTQLFVFLKWTGRNVTLIYFIQWIIIGNLATEVYRTVELPLYLFICYTFIPLLSCVMAYYVLKLYR